MITTTGSPMISMEEALQVVLNISQRLEPVTVSFRDSLGKVLAQDVRAQDPLPPYRASIKILIDSGIVGATKLGLLIKSKGQFEL
ncbi:hypothetical protein GIB67_005462 [Kingdonia uniflora]|uniref:Molybdopterin biosynthesis protein CNX1 n=1 Tax=Kingdonia uniflora TaxID=39325 RepID=A0A7J7NHW5_9MAGN|nr:hypothetical protein GIB67_005462 [Kingdonia uniflora]